MHFGHSGLDEASIDYMGDGLPRGLTAVENWVLAYR